MKDWEEADLSLQGKDKVPMQSPLVRGDTYPTYEKRGVAGDQCAKILRDVAGVHGTRPVVDKAFGRRS